MGYSGIYIYNIYIFIFLITYIYMYNIYTHVYIYRLVHRPGRRHIGLSPFQELPDSPAVCFALHLSGSPASLLTWGVGGHHNVHVFEQHWDWTSQTFTWAAEPSPFISYIFQQSSDRTWNTSQIPHAESCFCSNYLLWAMDPDHGLHCSAAAELLAFVIVCCFARYRSSNPALE